MHTIDLSQYSELQAIPRGGTSKVYRADRLADGQPVAVKVLDIYMHGSFFASTPYCSNAEANAQFDTEIAILSRLEHPRIPTLIEHGRLPDRRRAIVSTYVDATNLAYHLDRHGPMREQAALGYTAQLCDILAYLHSQGISMSKGTRIDTVNDIARGNLLIENTRGDIHLCDFGESTIGNVPAQRLDLATVAGLVLIMVDDEARPIVAHARTCPVLRAETCEVLAHALTNGYPSAAALGSALRALI